MLSSRVQATWLMEGLGGARRRLRAAAAASSSMGQDSTSEDAHMVLSTLPRLCLFQICIHISNQQQSASRSREQRCRVQFGAWLIHDASMWHTIRMHHKA